MTRSRIRAVLLAAAALALLAGPALAEAYTVTLRGGGTILSRYQPQEASWDKDMIMVLSEVGNWVALPRQEITSIKSDTNNRGFSKRLDASTVVLGWSANDYVEGEGGALGIPPPERSYDQNQFVDPEDLRGGLPATLPGSYSGSSGGFSVTQPAVPPPAPAAPPADGGATQ